MSFNNGNERRKLNVKWEHLRVQYREAGMSEDAIQAIHLIHHIEKRGILCALSSLRMSSFPSR